MYSLSHLLSNCSDFIEQKKDIEQLCNKITVIKDIRFSILFRPKYHCEIAGEGIEYSWGASKRYYRKEPLAMEKQTSNFKALVSTCIARINISMCRKFLRKARSYMLVYLHNKLKKEANGGATETL